MLLSFPNGQQIIDWVGRLLLSFPNGQQIIDWVGSLLLSGPYGNDWLLSDIVTRAQTQMI